MAGDTNVFRTRISELCSQNESCLMLFAKYLENEVWSENEWELILRSASQILLDPHVTVLVGVNLRPWLLELLGRAEAAARKTRQTGGGSGLHYALCVALSKLVTFSSNAARFCLNYFQVASAPFEREEKCSEPAAKKIKRQGDDVSERDRLQAALDLLFQVRALMDIWKCSHLLHYLKHSCEEVRWLACQCIGILSRMNEEQREKLILQHVSLETHRKLTVQNHLTPAHHLPDIWNDDISKEACPMSRHTVVVSGVSLSVFDKKLQDKEGCLVSVGSTNRNLEGVALGVCQGRPVLIQGPVGSGKTSLVEHLAMLTGRRKAPYLTKVQLGDQTDSKTLLGTYICTSKPGEFLWQPGSLTQAVTRGYWLLLEDIDFAPMDVISILVPLLESRTLPIPGQGNICAHPNFQLFTTRRTLAGAKLNTGCAGLLENHWTRVTLETLTRSELLQLVNTRWPKLKPVSDKLVTVYLMLSAGQHLDDVEDGSQEVVMDMTTVRTSGRLVSTRDFMKWCSRVASHIENTDMALASRAFQEALDCFCAAVPDLQTYFKFALHVGSYLNRTKAEVDHYCTQYKPEVKHMSNTLLIGKRANLPVKPSSSFGFHQRKSVTFSFTRPSACLLERIGVAIMNEEPVLIVGETGTGKTSTVQYLAHQTRHKLRVINMNQQSDSADLLGGYKPVQMKTIVSPVRQEFEELFAVTFSQAKNNKFLQHIMNCFHGQKWHNLFTLMEKVQKKALKKIANMKDMTNPKHLVSKWNKVKLKVANLKEQVQHAQSALAFSFIEGALIKAIQEGKWVLLDEINLASAETLECLSGLLESSTGSLTLLERGDSKPISRHPDFRLFACMNPATDVGKKELPAGLRNRFTEFFMVELRDKLDIMIIISDYLAKLGLTVHQIKGIQKFYKKVREAGEQSLCDGTGRKPHYSLRTLCRALTVAAANPCGSVPRSLYEAFCLSFLTQLDRPSHPVVVGLVKKYVMDADGEGEGTEKRAKLLLNPIPQPSRGKYVQVEGYWISQGALEPQTPENYILTETVRQNLRDLVRVVSVGKYPVLLQGDTSVGKTSLITYLATLVGASCVRINNHEHTDLQEYIGSYSPDETGKLVFREGVLVKAMQHGHWVILDELNLAPTDVLEALNRLLDDNRELFIPETQETVRAHPHFMLFATQNPPGHYGGRKVLSRAFRNRFVEMHFTEIPAEQLEIILHHRCLIPLSYSKKMVAVLQDLQNMRRGSNLFQGRQSFITLRDLFRWAERYCLAPPQKTKFYDWDQHLADEGYLVMGARVRLEEELEAIKKVLEKRLKRNICKNKLFVLSEDTSPVTKSCLKKMSTVKGFEHVVWTEDMRRLYVLVAKALKFKEPVLLVGDTGCGKTTVCQLIAAQNGQTLHTVNCHMHTEGADFLGGLRPVRSHDESDDRLFEWVDGPLINSMHSGGMFLADEISLADDSVLERLNSVLEPERVLVLTEKGTDGVGDTSSPEIIHAHDLFRFVGTMNPGGDYGKKELSPALRNRFTEIWCPKVEVNRVASDVITIIEHNISKEIKFSSEENTSGIGRAMLDFLEHFTRTDLGKKCILSIRDLLSWVQFINKVASHPTNLSVGLSYIHGACLVLLDGLGSGLTGSGLAGWKQLKEASLNFLVRQAWKKTGDCPEAATLQEGHVGMLEVVNSDIKFGISPFFISKGLEKSKSNMFTFKAPRTCINLLRLVRGLQLSRPLLLEGSPGVGKTSLVIALAKAAGHRIVRINLSEQTDVSDLFGADLPVERGKGGMFAWHDGPLLQALKQGAWIVLDELNLASQSVLEGLNACFDHRGEIFVPELGKTFQVKHQTTKIFACQNPQHQGGARKGLPKSFLNRFTQVHVEALSPSDQEFILGMMYSEVPQDIVTNMVKFNRVLTEEILDQGLWGQCGGPWDLNLRDLFRWCEIMLKNQTSDSYNPGDYVALIYSDRMRTEDDKKRVFSVYEQVFEEKYPCYQSIGRFHITKTTVQVGQAVIHKKADGDYSEVESIGDLYLVDHQLPVLESLINCVNMNWMALLVGDSSIGKTCVVKLLAQLTGQRLCTLTVSSDMDVTELLGGFQQVDFGRELGEVVEEAKEASLIAVRGALLAGSQTQADKILQAWDKLMLLRDDKTPRTTSGEVNHFQHQCELLLALLAFIPPHTSPTSEKIPCVKKKKKKQKVLLDVNGENSKNKNKGGELCERIVRLQESVKEACGVSGGGTFQWVDSTLVKAVERGSWLLVDGVNICSPSVLDRLNAMLEPGGKLTMSERGVVGGTVPSITPHPDFRLFLAMNPVHGEISRAMRNRGIEVCMMGSWRSPRDMLGVLLQEGLTFPPILNALVASHKLVTSCLPAYEKPSICQVKQVAALTRQLIEIGHPPWTALHNALDLVYARSQSKPAVKELVHKVMKKAAKKWKKLMSVDIPWPRYENQAVSIKRLNLGSNMCEVVVKEWLLHTLTQAITHPEAAASWISAALPLSHAMPVSELGLLHCIMMVLSTMPRQDWPLLEARVRLQVDNNTQDDASQLGYKVLSAIQCVLSSDQCDAAKLLESSVSPAYYYDPRFNLQTLSGQEIKKGLDLESLANKSSLWLWNTINSWYKQQCNPRDLESKVKQDSMTLFDISQALSKGLVSKGTSLHPSVSLIVPLLNHINQLLKALSNSIQIPFTDPEFLHLLTAMRWCDHFHQLSQQVVPNTEFHLFLPQLTLHWQWLYEEFLEKIPETWCSLVPEKLEDIVNRLQGALEREYGPLHKLAVMMRSQLAPAPFTSAVCADAQYRLINITSNLAPSLDNEKLNRFLASSLGEGMRELLIQVAREVTCIDSIDRVHDKISTLEKTVKEKCDVEENMKEECEELEESHGSSEETDTFDLKVQLWPLKDYLGILALSDKSSPDVTREVLEAPGVFRWVASALSGPVFRNSSVVSTHSYLALCQSTASLHTRYFLTYSYPPAKDEEEEEEEKRDCTVLHPATCQLSYIMLAGRKKPGTSCEEFMEEIQTGYHVEKVAQLKTTRSILWHNWATLVDPAASYEASFTRYATIYITTSMGTLANTLGIVPDFNIGMYDLHTASHLASLISECTDLCMPNGHKEKLKDLASLCLEIKNCEDDWSVKSSMAAHAGVIAGVIQASIVGCLEPVDPAHRTNLLLRYYNQELQDLESRLMLAEWFECLRGSITTPATHQVHPHLAGFKSRRDHLNATIHQLTQQVAYRRGEFVYQQLKQDFAHFMSTVFVPESIWQLLKSVESEENRKGHEAFITKVNVLLASCDNFVKKIIYQYPLYRDLTYLFLQAVTITCEALRLIVAHSHLKNLNLRCGGHLTDCLELYCAFPSPRKPDQPLQLLNNQLDLANVMKSLLPDDLYPNQAKIASNLILQAALLDFLNVSLAQHDLNRPSVEMASQLLDEVASIWRQQEEEKAQRTQEEESLYRYKARTIAVSKTEDEKEEEEFNKAFPSYHNEFKDLEGITLDDLSKSDGYTVREPEEVAVGYVTDEQLYEVSELHHLLFTSLVNTPWLAASTSKSVQSPSQVVKAALLRLYVLQSLVGNAGAVAGCSLDRAVVGALILGNSSACSLLTQSPPPTLITHPYDIYQDPNPQEVIKVRPLLHSVKQRVDELLGKWPGHPTLMMVNTVIARVLAFPLTSPLMRFIVGLETVLEKAQEWERNAHSGVSLMSQLEAVTHQVLEWRQLEVNAWRSCLDTVTHKVATQGRKWWPHLYSTFQAALTKEVSLPEVLKALKQFLETSTVGDFQTRLQLLYAFHCNTAVLERTKIAKSLLAISWNLYQYYSQFLPQVNTSMSEARQPIEKEVKGYVKIARWNDINYFAVRESVNKSHRTLHRHMRNWENKLLQPVSPILCDANSELTQNPIGAWDKDEHNGGGVSAAPTMPPVPSVLEHLSIAAEGSVLSRLSFLTQRCHKLTCRMLTKLPYSGYVDAVEDMTSDIVNNYQELQAAAARAENLTSEVRLKELRHVMQRRRDSLARLFKVLASVGVIYTRGNSQWHDNDIDACLSIPPAQIVVSHSKRVSLKSACQSWPDCVKYLNRCIGRLTLLLTSLRLPHSDLGPELIKQLRGISCHLFTLARDQRKALVRVSDSSSQLQSILEDLRDYKSQSPTCSKLVKGLQRLHEFSSSLSLVTAETQALLSGIPSLDNHCTVLDSALVLEQEHIHELQELLEESRKVTCYHTQKLASAMRHFKGGYRLVTPAKLKVYQESLNHLITETQRLRKVVSECSQHPALCQLTKWLTEWESVRSDIAGVIDPDATTQTEVTKMKYLETCVTHVLVSVENIYKRHCCGQSTVKENCKDEVVKNLLSSGLSQNLISDEKDLKAKEIISMLHKLVKASEMQPDLLKEAKAALPLFEQYQAICESVLLSLVSSNRSIAKLTSVLLGIFQHLAVKGFCRPQELEEEEGSEGANTFEDSSGTGLGEGEGKKDVSDRFESEDQLESALQEGETEKPGDEDLKEEDKGIEMSEDFEGKHQDVEQAEREENDSDDDDEEDEEFDKQMGETGEGADILDEKLWGEDEERDEEEQKGDQEEDGPGDGEVMESKMVAKDENKNKREKDKEQKQKEKLEEMEDTREENKLDEKDGEEYSDNFKDPYGGEADAENEDDEEKLELPDDMTLDDGEPNEKGENNESECDPMEIEEMGVFPEEEREPKEKEDRKNEDGQDDDQQPGKDEEDSEQKPGAEDIEHGENDNEEDDFNEEKKKDERMQGTEEKNDLIDEGDDDTEERADASSDKDTKTEAEAAEMDTTEGSRDKTKEQPKTETGGQREEEEDEKQDEQGQIGEQTENQDGTGQSESRTQEEAHKGESSALVTETSACDQNDMKKPRKPGETDENRTLGDQDKHVQQGLMTKERQQQRPQPDDSRHPKDQDEEHDDGLKGREYEHIDKAEDHMDAQMVDAGTQEQAIEAPAPADTQHPDAAEEEEEIMDTPMEVDEEEENVAGEEREAMRQESDERKQCEQSQGRRDPQAERETRMETEGEVVLECMVQRPPETYFHTLLPENENEEAAIFDEDVEKTRCEIEVANLQNDDGGQVWAEQEARVAPIALNLCEQLRLILEPTQAARLRGDFRTGKRLNMRKVIPYIASQFRKDKIWLRRTRPSKRTYQILVAVDDSESMSEAQAGSLAVESVALVTRALTLLEVGQLGVISFGATTKILHPLDQPFSEAAGSQILANLKFDQKVTNFSRMLEDSVAILNSCRTSSTHGNPDTAQLLMILSDGQTQTRSEAVRAAVRTARASRIFIVFLVLDAQDNKYSFYDVLVYEEGRMRPLVESFPFPFFLVVRDIETLPNALATALRQWFELVTADGAQ